MRETCEIALAKIEWDHSEEGRKHWTTTARSAEQYVVTYPGFIAACILIEMCVARAYTSVDPAPPTSRLLAGKAEPEDTSEENIAKLRNTLNDTSLPLFDRYRAMFALRNIGTPAAVDALASGFADDSALFKYVHRSIAHFLV